MRSPPAPREDLIAAWQEIYGRPPPANLSKRLLEMGLAYRRQVDVHGGPTRRVMDALRQAVKPDAPPPARRPKAGAMLIREWNGVSHVVEVLDDGYRYNDQRFKSLTPIARLITSAGWSGPRFFGLKKRAS